MKVEIITETRHSVKCPACNKHSFTVGHMLKPNNQWEWSCKYCFANWQFNYDQEHGLSMEQIQTKSIRGLALVKYTGNTFQNQLYFIVEVYFHYNKDGSLDPDWEDNKRYYIEEHTCPTNLVSCDGIIYNGDTDPHGVLKYVRSAPIPVICQRYGITVDDLMDSNNSYMFHYFHECGAGITDDMVGLDEGNVFDGNITQLAIEQKD